MPGQNFIPKHSQADRDRFFAAYKKHEGNLRRAATEVKISPGTCRYWLKRAKVEELDEATRELVTIWKGNVEEKLDKTLFLIFDAINRKVSKASLPDLAKTAKEILAMKKTMQGKANDTVNPDEADAAKNELEDKALLAIQRAEAKRAAAEKSPPLGDKILELPESDSGPA
jgi:hypothetical protein